MVDILQTTFSNAIYTMKKLWITIEMSLESVHPSPIDNKLALIKLIAWRLYMRQTITVWQCV